jgi:MFS family permease
MAMILAAFPAHERGKALGLQMSTVGAGAVAGPALGGLIVTGFGWRGVYLFTCLLAVLTIASAAAVLRPDRSTDRPPRRAFDWVGALLSAAVLVLFLLSMSNGPKIGWAAAPTLAGLAGTVVLLGAFLWWERRTPSPMLDLSLFANAVFTVGVVTRFINFLGLSSVRYLLPFYVQSVLGYSASTYGLIAVPAALCTIVISPLSGRLSDRLGWKKFTIAGLCLSATGLLLLSTLQPGSGLVLLILGWVIQSSGHAVFTAPNNSSVLSVVGKEHYGVTAGFLNMVRNAGNVTGTGIATAIVAGVMVSRGLPASLRDVPESSLGAVALAFGHGMKIAYVAPAVVVCVGAVMYALLRTRGAQAAPRPADG